MPTEPPCPNCGEPVPGGATLCPNCGATVPPLPTLTGKRNREPIEPLVYWTGSKRGDIVAGIALGIVTPIAVAVLCGFALQYPWWHHGDAFQWIAMLLAVVFPFSLPFVVARVLKHKHWVAGDAMQKTLWGWLILLGLSLLGLFAMCITGNFRLH